MEEVVCVSVCTCTGVSGAIVISSVVVREGESPQTSPLAQHSLMWSRQLTSPSDLVNSGHLYLY